MTSIDREIWKRLEPLLDQAIDLPPGERSPWLARLSEREPELASQLAPLLAAQDEVERSDFLTGAPEPSLAGLELGAYRLVQPLGQGGMGTVWLASRTDGSLRGLRGGQAP